MGASTSVSVYVGVDFPPSDWLEIVEEPIDCGHPVVDGAKFCPICGARYGRTTTTRTVKASIVEHLTPGRCGDGVNCSVGEIEAGGHWDCPEKLGDLVIFARDGRNDYTDDSWGLGVGVHDTGDLLCGASQESIDFGVINKAVADVARGARALGLSLVDEAGEEREIRLYVVGRCG